MIDRRKPGVPYGWVIVKDSEAGLSRAGYRRPQTEASSAAIPPESVRKRDQIKSRRKSKE